MGSGFRTFTAGEILTASNVQNYLQDQVVMTFAGSAARSSAIGTANFEEGMTSYLTDTDKMEVYNGTNWVSVAPTTSQGLTLINTTSFSGVSSQSFNDVFSATYDTYVIRGSYVGSADTGMDIRLRVSGADNSAANYERQLFNVSNSTTAFVRVTGQTSWINVAAHTTTYSGHNMIEIHRPFNTSPTLAISFSNTEAGATDVRAINQYMKHTTSTSFTGFTVLVSGTITGSISVYGYNK